MLEYILRRAVAALPVMIGILVLAFVVLYLIPGDPAATVAGPRASPEALHAIAAQMGLDLPLHRQFAAYFSRICHGDFGESAIRRVPVARLIREKLPVTLKLACLSMLVSIVVGVAAGILGAMTQGTWMDKFCTIFTVAGISVPVFLSGLVMLYLFGVRWKWFPTSAFRGADGLWPFVLPAITLGIRSGAFLARIVRNSLVEVLKQDFIRTARAKGLSRGRILWRHALMNALIPIITIIGLDFSSYLSGSVIVETIFDLPGLGRLAMDSILERDYPVIQGVVLLSAFIFVGINFLVDLLYAWINPRVRDEILGKATAG